MKKTVFSIAAIVGLVTASLAQADGLEDLQKQIDDLNGQVKSLKVKKEAPVPEKGKESYSKNPWERTTFGGYGELDYIFKKENGNGNGGNSFDPKRFVLYVNSGLSDSITLNAELEWEHGGSDGGAEGGVSVEQAYLTFKLAEQFNVKAGVMLMPVGAVNLYHEPTSFNSTNRPELDQIIIPTTWQEMGVGIYGKLHDKVDYQLLTTTGLDGSKFSAENGIREGRQDFGKDSNNAPAITGRVELRPLTNLYTNFSFYTGNSAPSGSDAAYTTVAAFDGKYSIAGFDLSGEYARVYQDKPANLGVTDIGHNMSGYWVEGAYHVIPEFLKRGKLSDSDAVVFARYSEFNTQDGGSVDPAKFSGRFDRNYTTFGIAFKPVTTVVVKADYQIYGDHRVSGEAPIDNDKFQVSLGFVF